MNSLSEQIQVREVSLTYKRRVDLSDNPKVSSSKDACDIIKPFFEETGQIDLYEYMYAIYMNTDGRVISVMRISEGGTTGTVADVKKILAPAILQNASSIILAHNHPSGNTIPSSCDKNITAKVKKFGELIDVTLLDHLIITRKTYRSFADEGLIDTF